jgi:hypothetical protein
MAAIQVATHMVIFDLSDAQLDAPLVHSYDWFTKPKPALLEFPFVPDFLLPSTSSLQPFLHHQISSGSVFNEGQDSSLEPPATESKKLPVGYDNALEFVDMCAVWCSLSSEFS